MILCGRAWSFGKRQAFGIYNVVNPGAVTTRRIVEMIQQILKPARQFEFWESDEEFYGCATKTPRSNCVLDVSKLLTAGVKMRSSEEALKNSLQNWSAASSAWQQASRRQKSDECFDGGQSTLKHYSHGKYDYFRVFRPRKP